jgi:glycolate oxidase iron-sulfur subunit
MQTDFKPYQLLDPEMAASEAVIRKCVRCGFCTATCPTYLVLGDELDGPRGRIYLMKEMLEKEQQPTKEVVLHIDRCLSCFACMTTCPSGVNYMHLVDHARAYIEEHYRRPLRQRVLRGLLAWLMPHPKRFRLALRLARFAKPAAALAPELKAMLALAPKRVPPPAPAEDSPAPVKRGRVALMQGCVEAVIDPAIRAAAVRMLNRAGYDVVFVKGEGCCGSLEHHMGKQDPALAAARRNVDLWTREIEQGGLDAIVVTLSGCGTTIKDYGFMLRADPAYADQAARVSALARDVSEILAGALPPAEAKGLKVAYHPACSLQHGQRIVDAPARLLAAAGYQVALPAEAHLCCGSAGTYNLLQPEIAGQLRDRKLANIAALEPDVIATGNIGCMVQLRSRANTPVVHTVELLDWATGGPMPPALVNRTPEGNRP